MAKIDASPSGADAERDAEHLVNVQEFLKSVSFIDSESVSYSPRSSSTQKTRRSPSEVKKSRRAWCLSLWSIDLSIADSTHRTDYHLGMGGEALHYGLKGHLSHGQAHWKGSIWIYLPAKSLQSSRELTWGMRGYNLRFLHHDGISSLIKARLLAICWREQDIKCDLPKTCPGGWDSYYWMRGCCRWEKTG
jgi:hypothetical protein